MPWTREALEAAAREVWSCVMASSTTDADCLTLRPAVSLWETRREPTAG